MLGAQAFNMASKMADVVLIYGTDTELFAVAVRFKGKFTSFKELVPERPGQTWK